MNNYTISFFQNGIGTENNETEIFECYKLAAEFNPKNSLAWFNLVFFYYNEIGTDKNEAESFKCFKKSVELNPDYSDALFYLVAIF